METVEDKYAKDKWPPGPWHREPDQAEWTDAQTGYLCVVARNLHSSGCLNGYVRVPDGHPAHGLLYQAGVIGDLNIHGSVNYSSSLAPSLRYGTARSPNGEPADDGGWWFGFSADHARDYSPMLQLIVGEGGFGSRMVALGDPHNYRDLPYVMREVMSLARQLKALEGSENNEQA